MAKRLKRAGKKKERFGIDEDEDEETKLLITDDKKTTKEDEKKATKEDEKPKEAIANQQQAKAESAPQVPVRKRLCFYRFFAPELQFQNCPETRLVA